MLNYAFIQKNIPEYVILRDFSDFFLQTLDGIIYFVNKALNKLSNSKLFPGSRLNSKPFSGSKTNDNSIKSCHSVSIIKVHKFSKQYYMVLYVFHFSRCNFLPLQLVQYYLHAQTMKLLLSQTYIHLLSVNTTSCLRISLVVLSSDHIRLWKAAIILWKPPYVSSLVIFLLFSSLKQTQFLEYDWQTSTADFKGTSHFLGGGGLCIFFFYLPPTWK